MGLENMLNSYYYFFALVLHSQGREISKTKICPEWLRWGLGNYERVGKAYSIETLNCHWNTLVHEHCFPQIGCAKRGSSAYFCNEAVSLVWQGTKSLYRQFQAIDAAKNLQLSVFAHLKYDVYFNFRLGGMNYFQYFIL